MEASPAYRTPHLSVHFPHLHAPLCGIFAPNSGYVARYTSFIRVKFPQSVTHSCQKPIFKHALDKHFI
ncbi:DUF6783 domain-containing protein [Robinsoniella peoriensis]|uniref:DUF6783 domain-containing protein n=1 Tax=Robinsoniella peoriensis TaxID=180332 RepID=UPI0036424D7F